MKIIFPFIRYRSGKINIFTICVLLYLSALFLDCWFYEPFNTHSQDFKVMNSGMYLNEKANIPSLELINKISLFGFLLSALSIFASPQKKKADDKKKGSSLTESAYREVFYNSPILFLIVDENLSIIAANKSAEEFSGKSGKEAAGTLPGIALNCIRGDVKPGCGNHPECGECPLRKAIEQTFATENAIKNAEAEFVSKSGKKTTHYNTLLSTSLISLEGEKAVLVSLTDVTAQKQTGMELQKTETKFHTLVEYTYDWEFWLSPENYPVYHSPSCMRISGYSVKNFMESPNLLRDIIHPDDVAHWENLLYKPSLGLHSNTIEFRIVTASGNIKWIELMWTRIYDNNGRYLGLRGSNRDITDRVMLERLYKAQLRLSELSLKCTMDELLQAALDEAELLSQSKIGFFHFVDPDQNSLRLQMWSTNTIKNMCSAQGKGDHYSIDKAGVWVDCVHQRKPVIHNNYAELPNKKGLPEGHAPVIREMAVPIMRDEKIVAIIGVGNKSSEYTAKDLEIMCRLTDLIWDIVHKKQIENILAESEIKYRQMIETASEGIIITDSNGIITYTNPQIQKLLGYEAEELTGNIFIKFCCGNPDHNASDKTETCLRKKDGTHCFVTIASSQVEDSVTESAGCFLMITDITAKKSAEEKIRISEEKYRLIVENQTELIVKAKPDGTLIFVSPSYCNLFGKTEQELLDRSYIPLIHEDDRESTMKEMEKLYTAPHTCYIEQRVYTKDGLRWIAWSDKAIFDETGKMQIIIGSGRDITERKIADDALKVSEEKFSKAFHTSPDSININRLKDGMYIDVNEGFCQMTGFAREEVIGKTSYEIDIWVDHNDRDKLVKTLLSEGECKNLEAKFRFKDGFERTGLMSAKIINVNNEVCILSVSRDISERIKAEAIIKKSLLEKETLLRELYHRTKNNMQVISAILTLQSVTSTNPEVFDILKETSNRIKAMSLVHQKLYQSNDLSRIQLSSYIRELIELLLDFYAVDKANIEIALSLSEEFVLIDYAMPCGLIINEIVSNAFKYAFPNGRKGVLEIKLVRDENSRIRMLFKDNGVGFPADFDYEAPVTLGLQLVYSLVRHQLDGDVEIKGNDGVEISFSFFDNLYGIRI